MFAVAGRLVIYPSRRLIYSGLTGPTSRDEILMLRRQAAQHPDFDAAFDVIVDLRTADLSALSAGDIAMMASTTALDQTARRALVAGSADRYGIARMYEARRALAGGNEQIRVVHTMAEAVDWLGHQGFDPSRENE